MEVGCALRRAPGHKLVRTAQPRAERTVTPEHSIVALTQGRLRAPGVENTSTCWRSSLRIACKQAPAFQSIRHE